MARDLPVVICTGLPSPRGVGAEAALGNCLSRNPAHNRCMNSREMFSQLAQIFSTGDTSSVESLFHSTYVDHQKPQWLDAGGPEEFKEIVVSARRALPNLIVDVIDPVVADGGAVAGRMRWHSDKGERETIEILRLDNGLFVEHWGAEVWSKPGPANTNRTSNKVR